MATTIEEHQFNTSIRSEVVENVKVYVGVFVALEFEFEPLKKSITAGCGPLSPTEHPRAPTRPSADSPCGPSKSTNSVTNPSATSRNEPNKCYTFNEVFEPGIGQLEVYSAVARPIVENVLRGFNGAIFAYGQTGTGKTYTMSGDGDRNVAGIIQHSFGHIFDHISSSGHEKRFLVRISYMEIYNEEVRDLLARPSQRQQQPISLEIKERHDIGVYVKDLVNVTVNNVDQCMRIMEFGNSNRQTGRTAMNEQSSRSHAIFTITIECSETIVDNPNISTQQSSTGIGATSSAAAEGQGQQRQMLTQGKLSFVDLAGSERQSKTQSEGQRLKEATKINLSLSTLGNVISALAEHGTHIPYRNSKLTRILSDSLGGNSKTCMIANVGPADYNYEETISTLRYASRAKCIQNVARINQDPKDALLRRFQDEIEQLRRQLAETDLDQNISDVENETDGGSGAETDDEKQQHQQQMKKLDKKKGEATNVKLDLVLDGPPSNSSKEPEQSLFKVDEVERRRLAEDLARREEDLQRNRREREKLVAKLAAIERQIIVGGENILERVEQQSQLLEESHRDLELTRQSEQNLNERYRSQQAEQLDIEEKNATLQEQSQMLSKKLKKVWTQYMNAKGELHDQEMDHHRQTEALLENIRQLERELLYAQLVLEETIPEKQQRYIEKFVHWNEEIGDWQLKCIAYAGNNIRRETNNTHSAHYKPIEPQQPLYLSYADFIDPNEMRPASSASSYSKARQKEAARIRKILE